MGVEIDTAVTNEITLDERLTNEGGFDRSIRLLRNITGLWIIQEVRRDLKSQGIDISYVELVELAQKESQPWRTLFYVDAPIFVYAGNMIARIQEYARETGQPVPETPGELAQATFASLALAYARTADVLADVSGDEMPTIHIVGGGAQNAHLSQMTADISGREVVTGPIEATAIGNALVQAIASGDVKDIGSARKLISESSLHLGRYKPKISSGEKSEIAEVRNRYAQLTVLEEK
jgi:rhamnulokinase